MIRKGFRSASIALCAAAVILPSRSWGQSLMLPEMRSFTLTNGLKVIVVENHDQPAVLYTMMFKSGTLSDPMGKEGRTELMGRLLERGSEKYDADRLAERIDHLGARFGIEVERDYLGVEMMVLAKDQLEGLDILADVVLRPTFAETELELARKELIAEVKSAMDEPSWMATDNLRSLIFRKDERGRIKTLASLKAIVREDVVACHEQRFAPSRGVLVVIGDISYDSVAVWIRDQFVRVPRFGTGPGGLSIPDLRSMTTGHPAGPPPSSPPPRIRLVDKPGLTQSFIALGFPSINRGDSDYFAYLAMNHILGGAGFASRLQSVVRAQEGKTYSISSRFEAGVRTGPFLIRTFTQAGQTKEMVDLIVRVMRAMKEKGITEEELTRMKSSQIGGYQLRFQTPQDLAREILTTELFNLGLDYLKTYPEKINALTVEEINQAARRYLDVDSFSLAIVSDRSTVDTVIKTLGRFETVPFEDLYTR